MIASDSSNGLQKKYKIFFSVREGESNAKQS